MYLFSCFSGGSAGDYVCLVLFYIHKKRETFEGLPFLLVVWF